MQRAILRVVVCLAALAGSAAAQAIVDVTGTVSDSSRAVLIGATVEAVVLERVVSRATTGEGGRYTLQVPGGVRYSCARATRASPNSSPTCPPRAPP